MKSIVEVSHDFLKPALHPQAVCIDATLGQGKDTRFFLDQKVHRVHAFEVQEYLIQQIQKTITDSRLVVHATGHENMKQALDLPEGSVDAILFNLGWDPKDPDSLTTKTETTLQAVAAALPLLKVKGRMAIVVYPHEEGVKEKEALLEWLSRAQGVDIMEAAMKFKECPSALLVEKKINWKGII